MTASEPEFECCNNHLKPKASDVGVGSVGLLLSSEGVCRIGKLSMKNGLVANNLLLEG